MKKDSSGKDTRKENEKANQSILFELCVSLLHYFSAVYHIEGYIRNMTVR